MSENVLSEDHSKSVAAVFDQKHLRLKTVDDQRRLLLHTTIYWREKKNILTGRLKRLSTGKEWIECFDPPTESERYIMGGVETRFCVN